MATTRARIFILSICEEEERYESKRPWKLFVKHVGGIIRRGTEVDYKREREKGIGGA